MQSFWSGSVPSALVVFLAIAVTVVLILYIRQPELQDWVQDRTNTMQSDSAKVLLGPEIPFYIVAHRGAKAYYPENTMPAFRAANQMGANMIELDVRLSQDGVPVVIHDKRVGRTTDGRGAVASFTVQELKKLDAGSWFAKRFADTLIPTLEEVLRWAQGRIALNIELKPRSDQAALHGGLEEKVVNLVKKYGMDSQVLISSFNYKTLHHLDVMNPELAIGLLYNWQSSGRLLPSELVTRYGADAFHCSKDGLNRRWVHNLKNRDIPFMVYTVNRKRAMKRIYLQGARGIITNKPDVLRNVVDTVNRPDSE